MKKELGISEYWCGRLSKHTTESVRELSRRTSRRASDSHRKSAVANANGRTHGGNGAEGLSEVERQAKVMSVAPQGLYERFRRGLLEYHSEVS